MKKGFTLMELLAVIVIIAIIILVAAPIIINIINNSKKEAFKRSVEGIIREYEYNEVYNVESYGEKEACNFQTTCKIHGTIKRNNEKNIEVNLHDSVYCAKGIKDALVITNYPCE